MQACRGGPRSGGTTAGGPTLLAESPWPLKHLWSYAFYEVRRGANRTLGKVFVGSRSTGKRGSFPGRGLRFPRWREGSSPVIKRDTRRSASYVGSRRGTITRLGSVIWHTRSSSS